MLPQFAGLGLWPLGAPSVTESASAAALAPVAAASLAAVVAASGLALPICKSQSTGLGCRVPAAAAASEDPATSSISVASLLLDVPLPLAHTWLPQVTPPLLPP